MRIYEAVFIFRPEDDQFNEGKKFVQDLFAKEKCKILKEEDMGDRELAYEIKKNTRGHYLFYEIETEPETLSNFERSLKLRNEILKSVFFRKEE